MHICSVHESKTPRQGSSSISPSPIPSPTSLPSPVVVRPAGVGNDQKRESHDTQALECTESVFNCIQFNSVHTTNVHDDDPDWYLRTCKCTTVVRAVREETVGAGVRARMCASADSFVADKSLVVVPDVERSAGPHHVLLVLRRGDCSGEIIEVLSLMPDLFPATRPGSRSGRRDVASGSRTVPVNGSGGVPRLQEFHLV